MPDRLKKLIRLRKTWELRKKALEHRIAGTGVKIANVATEEELLLDSLGGLAGTGTLFPELVTRRLAKLSSVKSQLNRELDGMRQSHRADSQNLRRSEILEERQRKDVGFRHENAALETTLEVFLATRRDAS